MSPLVIPAPTPVYRRVMIFIDGGYLREGFKRIYKHDRIRFPALYVHLKNSVFEEKRAPEVIRAYYYDCIIDAEIDLAKYRKQKEYFDDIQQFGVYEVKLARLKETKKGRKQKGADVKLAVDMITKALMNHYDIAILLSGDDDFLDLVRVVKDFTDKRVYGAFYPDEISDGLLNSFDKKIPLTKIDLDKKLIVVAAKDNT